MPHPFSFLLYSYSHYVQNVNFWKHIWIHASKNIYLYTHFKISSWDEVFTYLLNSKRHFAIGRDDFILGQVSSRDEILRVNTLLEKITKLLYHAILLFRVKQLLPLNYCYCWAWAWQSKPILKLAWTSIQYCFWPFKTNMWDALCDLQLY